MYKSSTVAGALAPLSAQPKAPDPMSVETSLHQPDWLDSQQPSLGRYILGPILGQGGAGEVREAWDVVLCRTVALKVLRKMEPVGLIRFMHEAQIQSRMVHPNICHLYDVDTSGGIPKIAMQLVRGPTLAQAAQELTVKEVATVLAQVAEAVHAAHRIQLIHRDLKPSNILLERGPQGRWVPFVCDFGLAMALDEPSLTLGPGLLGTPAFMAPEQILGQRRLVGPGTDIFSLGVTLYFSLYGEVPESGPGRTGRLELRRQDVFTTARQADPDLPWDLETILRRCLETEPQHRYGSAQALAEDLWRFAEGTPIRARPVNAVEQLWRRFRPYRLLAATALLTVGALLTGRLVELGRLDRDQRSQADSARTFMLEAADLEKELRLEKMLPIHDMRPTFARIRTRMADLRARMASLEPARRGPAYYALGRAHLVLRDFPAAKENLEQAWALGFRGAEVAWPLARSLVGAKYQADRTASFRTGQVPDPAGLPGRVLDLLRLGQVEASDSAEYAHALVAHLNGDFALAAAQAHASFQTHPWRYESAAVESISLTGLGQLRYDAGDLRGAEQAYREAMAAAGRFLAVGQSDELTQHAYFTAAGRLAHLLVSRGRFPLARLDRLQQACGRALAIDPGAPELLADWLQFSVLKARQLSDLGQDAQPGLRTALAFLAAQGREPLAVELQAARMQLHWCLAQACLAQGQDPQPDLRAALLDLGHTRALAIKDFFGDLLNFKARVEAGRGEDPRPTLAAALAQPAPPEPVPWTLSVTAAESWLLQAQWEAGHGLDPRSSLRRSQALVERGLRLNDRSSMAHAVKGLGLVLEQRLDGEPRPDLRRLAQRQLDRARELNPVGWHQAHLQRALEAAAGIAQVAPEP